jgi:hypothetical protein
MTNPTPPPPTRIISFQQQVLEADPDWNRRRLRPWVYDFSNGRLFVWNPDVYTTTST